jgi:hypothetical protein
MMCRRWNSGRAALVREGERLLAAQRIMRSCEVKADV